MKTLVKYRIRLIDDSWSDQYEYIARDEGAMAEVNARLNEGDIDVMEMVQYPDEEEVLKHVEKELRLYGKGLITRDEASEMIGNQVGLYLEGVNL